MLLIVCIEASPAKNFSEYYMRLDEASPSKKFSEYCMRLDEMLLIVNGL